MVLAIAACLAEAVKLAVHMYPRIAPQSRTHHQQAYIHVEVHFSFYTMYIVGGPRALWHSDKYTCSHH